MKYNVENVELHITDACTHRCPYCYVDAKLTPSSKYSDFEKLKKIIDELALSKVKSIALLGGDPVRHPQFVDIAKYVKQCGIKVSCMSNTMSIKEYTPDQLKTIINSIDTTIHASIPKEHDDFCNCPEAYDSLMNYLNEYSHLGVIVNIVVNIIPQTYDKIYEIVKSVVSRGVIVTTLLTQRILPFGRAENSVEYNVNAEQVNIAFSQIEKVVSEFGIEISVEDPYPLCYIEEKYWKFMHGCPEGINRIAIGLDGNVSRCGAVPDYSMGNILTTPLLQIWEASTIFNSVRACSHLTLPECLNCQYRERCCGGCPVNCEMCNSLGKNFIHEFRGHANATF
jgi:radical SAM protein with 4Fe4S-binding SPASM domain